MSRSRRFTPSSCRPRAASSSPTSARRTEPPPRESSFLLEAQPTSSRLASVFDLAELNSPWSMPGPAGIRSTECGGENPCGNRLSGREQDLSEVPALGHVKVSISRLVKREAPIDDRIETALFDELHELGEHRAGPFGLTPETAEVDPEHAPVLVHEIERLEARKREEGLEDGRDAPARAGREGRGAEDEEAAERRQRRVTLGERGAADSVEDHVDAAAAGQPGDL